jgi:peptide-methionine (S)-S-oxide reductase
MRTAMLTMMLTATGAAALPAPQRDEPRTNTTATIVLAGGCFWCTEAVFESLNGVVDVASGYAGGDADQAHYRAVASGRTEHAEAVQITYRADQITLGQLLQVFFATHDPTSRDRQGPDSGRQYRSAIFYANESQREIAEAYIAQLTAARVFAAPIVTTLEPLRQFYPAEEYHQDFAARHPDHPYIRAWWPHKRDKLLKHFADRLKTPPPSR